LQCRELAWCMMERSWTFLSATVTFSRMLRRRFHGYCSLLPEGLFPFLFIHRKSKCWKREYMGRGGIGTDRCATTFFTTGD
jgi:hypothetical protein